MASRLLLTLTLRGPMATMKFDIIMSSSSQFRDQMRKVTPNLLKEISERDH